MPSLEEEFVLFVGEPPTSNRGDYIYLLRMYVKLGVRNIMAWAWFYLHFTHPMFRLEFADIPWNADFDIRIKPTALHGRGIVFIYGDIRLPTATINLMSMRGIDITKVNINNNMSDAISNFCEKEEFFRKRKREGRALRCEIDPDCNHTLRRQFSRCGDHIWAEHNPCNCGMCVNYRTFYYQY